jgi:hypothetical protein
MRGMVLITPFAKICYWIVSLIEEEFVPQLLCYGTVCFNEIKESGKY